jgi:hypothetical protein
LPYPPRLIHSQHDVEEVGGMRPPGLFIRPDQRGGDGEQPCPAENEKVPKLLKFLDKRDG